MQRVFAKDARPTGKCATDHAVFRRAHLFEICPQQQANCQRIVRVFAWRKAPCDLTAIRRNVIGIYCRTISTCGTEKLRATFKDRINKCGFVENNRGPDRGRYRTRPLGLNATDC